MAGLFFALMTFFVRMAGSLPTMQKAFFRNAVAAVAALFLLARSEEGFKIKKSSWRDLFFRSFFGTVFIYFFGTLYFMVSTNNFNLGPVLMVTMVPVILFLAISALKFPNITFLLSKRLFACLNRSAVLIVR